MWLRGLKRVGLLGEVLGSVIGTSRRACSAVASGSSLCKLPWSVVKPYGSIRVNLTEAYPGRWNEVHDFPQQLQSRS